MSATEVIQTVGAEDVDFGTGTNADAKSRVNASHIKFSSAPATSVDQLFSGTAINGQCAAPINDLHMANRKYVDDSVAAGSGTDKGSGATNLSVIRPGVTNISLTADSVVVTGASGQIVIPVTTALTAFITTVGAGGLDIGIEAISTWYYIFVIHDSSGVAPNALLLSANPTVLTRPSGYTHQALVSAVYNDSGSNFRDFYHISDEYYYPTLIGIGGIGTLEAKTALPYLLVKSANITAINNGGSQYNGSFGNDGVNYPIHAGTVQNTMSNNFSILVKDKTVSSVKLYSNGSGGSIVFSIYGFSTIK